MRRSEARRIVKESGVFRCELCNNTYSDAYVLKLHLDSLVHHPERKVSYDCNLCNFHTIQKTIFKTHENTKKHKKRIMNLQPHPQSFSE